MTNPTRSAAAAVALAALMVGPAGCGSKPKTGTVSGQVTLKGKPFTGGGVVTFTPVDAATGNPVTTPLDADGTYSASNVPYGDLRVGVSPVAVIDEEEEKYRGMAIEHIPAAVRPKIEAARAARAARPLLPDKYKDPLSSGLKFTLAEPAATHTVAIP